MKKESVIEASVAVLVAVFILCAAAVMAAQTTVWKWVDEKGGIHFVEQLYQVPEKYRSKAVKVTITPPDSEATSGSSSKGSKSSSSTTSPSDKNKKAQWQQKARQTVFTVARLEAEVKNLEEKCPPLQHKATVMPTIANRKASIECAEKLENSKKELATSQAYLSKGIYADAARNAVPRDWIDEAIQQARNQLAEKNKKK